MTVSDTTDYMVPALNDGEVFRNELVIKKSRFIASVGHTKGVDEAEAFLNKIRREFPDARHNCHAFNAGRGNETAFIGCSDDGEPKCTAVRPMLNVLVHSGVGEITVVVTRYFGGILLGTGGLVRAYQDSVKAVLDKLPLKEPEDISELRFAAGISEIHLVEKLAVRYGAGITSRDFTDTGCNFRITVNVKRAEELKKELELLHGKYS